MEQNEGDLSFKLRKLVEEQIKSGLEINLDNTKYLTTTQEAVMDLYMETIRKETNKFKNFGFVVLQKPRSRTSWDKPGNL